MRTIIFKIQTKRCTWKVKIDWYGVSFYIIRNSSYWEKIPDNAVPRTIRRRARSFLLQPERFGVVKWV